MAGATRGVGPYMGKGHIRGGDWRMGHARGVRPSRGKGATGHIMVGTTRGHRSGEGPPQGRLPHDGRESMGG